MKPDVKHRERVSVPEIDESADSQRSQFSGAKTPHSCGEAAAGSRQDLLYAHDTIEVFSANLEELRNLYIGEIRPTIHSKRAKELREAGSTIFSKVNDTVREAVRMAIGRKLDPGAMVETCRAGMDEIFLKE